MKAYLLIVLLLPAGCATAPSTAESQREIVLQHIGIDAGTAGPFSKGAKRELEILSEKDRIEAAKLVEHGAVTFLVYPKRQGSVRNSSPKEGTRVVLVQHGRVVGDFKAP